MIRRALCAGVMGLAALLVCGCAGRDAASASPVAQADSQAPNGGIAIKPANPPRHVMDEPPTQTSGPDANRAIPCATRDVTLKPGGNASDFNGMSHSGTFLVLTNRSRTACSIPGLPQLTFLDTNGPVKSEADLAGAKFMHPGPVVLPLVLQPKQSVTTSARWASGPVFQDNLCYKLTGVTLALRDGSVMTPLSGQMCGERSKGVRYDLQRYGAGAK